MTTDTPNEPTSLVADPHAWRNWLWLVLALAVAGCLLLWLAVVLIDPFSTGRFALTQRVDITAINPRLADAALVRDPRFNAAILGDSTAVTIDPRAVAGSSAWRVLQLSLYGASAPEIVTVADAFERHHRGVATLEIIVMSNQWCGTTLVPVGLIGMGGPIPFQSWLYDSSDAVYLSRLLSSEAVALSVKRVNIWLGRSKPELRDDGFLERPLERHPPALLKQRPTAGPSPMAPFPSLDLLAAHIDALPDNRAVAIVLVPIHVSALPVAGSAGAARLEACKQRIHDIAARRPRAAYLDLMVENAISMSEDNYADSMHMAVTAVPQLEAAIAQLLEQNGLRPE
jgi:hypothetical protein